MPVVRDAADVRWTVRRIWWPFGTWLLDLPDWGGLFTLGLVLLAPLVVIWPFWLLARFLGAPWTIVVRRKGREQSREQVKGWAESRARMATIIAEVQRPDGEPELRAVVH